MSVIATMTLARAARVATVRRRSPTFVDSAAPSARSGSSAFQRSARARLGTVGTVRSPPPTTATGLMRRCARRPSDAATHTASPCFPSSPERTDIDADVSTTR